MTLKWTSEILLGLSLPELNTTLRSRRRYMTEGALTANQLSQLLSLSDLEQVVMTMPMHSAMVRAWKGGSRLPDETYSVQSGSILAPIRYVDSLKLFRCFENGATLVFWDMQRYWPPLTKLSWDLSSQLGCAATVSGWLSPPQVQGVVPHFDYHDIIVVQIAGRKEWLSFNKNAILPLDETRWRPVTGTVDPSLLDEGAYSDGADVLNAGDVMFLPRGDSHAVKSADEITLHLTISLHQWTPYDVAAGVLARVAENERLREPLDVGSTNRTSLSDEAMAEATEGFADLSKSVNVRDVSWELYKNSHQDLVESPVPFISQYACLADFDRSTMVRRRPDLLFAVDQRNDCLLLRLRDRTLRLPLSAQGLVEAAMSGAQVSAESVGAAGSSIDMKVKLLRALVAEGALITALAEHGATSAAQPAALYSSRYSDPVIARWKMWMSKK